MNDQLSQDEVRKIYLSTRDEAQNIDRRGSCRAIDYIGWIAKVQKLLNGYNEGAFTAQEVFDTAVASAVQTDYAQVNAVTGKILKGWELKHKASK